MEKKENLEEVKREQSRRIRYDEFEEYENEKNHPYWNSLGTRTDPFYIYHNESNVNKTPNDKGKSI